MWRFVPVEHECSLLILLRDTCTYINYDFVQSFLQKTKETCAPPVGTGQDEALRCRAAFIPDFSHCFAQGHPHHSGLSPSAAAMITHAIMTLELLVNLASEHFQLSCTWSASSSTMLPSKPFNKPACASVCSRLPVSRGF